MVVYGLCPETTAHALPGHPTRQRDTRWQGHNRTGRSKAGGPFVKLEFFMLNTAAWAALSPQARAIYIELRQRFNGRNNGRIGLSVREAAELCRMNRDTASKGLKALEELGFVETVTPGGFSRKVRHSTEWRLTTDPCDVTGELPSKAFMRWRPDGGAENKSRSENRAGTVPPNGTVTAFPARKYA